MKTGNLIYKVLSNEFAGRKMEFSSKREALRFAAGQRKAGWTAEVRDMRTGEVVR